MHTQRTVKTPDSPSPKHAHAPVDEPDPKETLDWLSSWDDLRALRGAAHARSVLSSVVDYAARTGVTLEDAVGTPYRNTIPIEREPAYPGDLALEARIESHLRWNAAVMVHRANSGGDGLGGHISTYAAASTLYEVGLHHVFRGHDGDAPGDAIFYQPHAAPGLYARAFLEGRLDEARLGRFRRECDGAGLPSYPHPWLLPELWTYPTASMGLGPIGAVYEARTRRYLRDRGLARGVGRVYCFLGDGECDEPEALGAAHIAAHEGLSNLTFVVSCNLQRLDGPVRGNGQIVQELERRFRGAGWNVLKVVFGGGWDDLFAKDAAETGGQLARTLEGLVDGEWQKLTALGAAGLRERLFGRAPALARLVSRFGDEDFARLSRGGHDPRKVYAAYAAALGCADRPSVILAMTVKGFGLGAAGESRNTSHMTKKLAREHWLLLRDRLGLRLPDERAAEAPLLRLEEGSAELRYLRDRRAQKGGPLPASPRRRARLAQVDDAAFERFFAGSGGRPASTTGALVQLLAQLMTDPKVGAHVVPIVPDEARTFGLDGLFGRFGVYHPAGQRYEAVDHGALIHYRESSRGQILQEGILEAGAAASFAAAGSAHATAGVALAPFYLFYSMFGFQRTGDSFWSFADQGARGFLCGATSGRTTLNGEGLQHQDGQSLLYAHAHPRCRAYDPAFAYELALIVREGWRRMFVEDEARVYYLAVYNEAYAMRAMPAGRREEIERGVLGGIYRLQAPRGGRDAQVHLLGSGPLVGEALRAQALLAEGFGIAADVFSVTSYGELHRDALRCERARLLGEACEVARITAALPEKDVPSVAVTDYVKALPGLVAPFVPGGLTVLGTDGLGRSDTRAALRRFFEVDAEAMALAALVRLCERGVVAAQVVARARESLGYAAGKTDPAER